MNRVLNRHIGMGQFIKQNLEGDFAVNWAVLFLLDDCFQLRNRCIFAEKEELLLVLLCWLAHILILSLSEMFVNYPRIASLAIPKACFQASLIVS